MQSKLLSRLYSGKSERVCGLFSTMVGLTKGIAACFSGQRRCKVDGMERVSAGVKYRLLEDMSVNDGVPYHLGRVLKEVKHNEVCSEVFKLLDGKEINTVALYGVGGIGKSTLLKNLENDALGKNFSIVLRVDVATLTSGGVDLKDKIYEAFIVKHGLISRDHIPTPSLDKPYLLLLDNMLKPISMTGSKFPFDRPGKIVFTTEEQDMSGEALNVLPFDSMEAWELFDREMGEKSYIFSEPAKKQLAKDMVEECHGLPLALKILAGGMKNWEKSLELLKGAATQLDDPNSLLMFIKFVLNDIPMHEVTECFLYTTMFPNSFCISEESLIEFWIGEGFFYSKNASQPDSRMVVANFDAGQQVIEKLKSLNLLEECALTLDYVDKSVKVPDSLRKIILDHHYEMLVQSGLELKQAPRGKMWEIPKRISLMSNEIVQLKERPKSCQNLKTLLMNENYSLVELHKSFFSHMPHVRVLDLSHTCFKELPRSIGTMVSLQYLNLSFSAIESLPEELGKLTKLRCLKLDRTGGLESIPSQLLSKFSNLQVFSIIDGAFALSEDNEYLVEEMKGLKDLGLLKIGIRNIRLFNKLSKIQEISQSLIHLQMSKCLKEESIDFLLLFGLMGSLRDLLIGAFSDLREIIVRCTDGVIENKVLMPALLENLTICAQLKLETFTVEESSLKFFHNLRTLKLYSCPLLRDISWVKYLPNLVDLALVGNSIMDNLFVENMGRCEVFFPKLKIMTLSQLHGLKYICDSVKFPSLEILTIFVCPNLIELPDSLLDGNAKRIKCDWEWWKVFSKRMSTKENSNKCTLIPHFVDGIGLIFLSSF